MLRVKQIFVGYTKIWFSEIFDTQYTNLWISQHVLYDQKNINSLYLLGNNVLQKNSLHR